jgi:hypothetical protein
MTPNPSSPEKTDAPQKVEVNVVGFCPTPRHRQLAEEIATHLAAEEHVEEGPHVPVDPGLARQVRRVAIRLVRVGWNPTAKESQLRLAQDIARDYGDASYLDTQTPRSQEYERWHLVIEGVLGHFARSARNPGGLRRTPAEVLLIVLRNLRWRAPEAQSLFFPAEKHHIDNALAEIKKLFFNPKGCRVAVPGKKRPGGGLISPWAAAVGIAKQFGAEMPKEKSDSQRKRNRT